MWANRFGGVRLEEKWLVTITVTLGMFMSLMDHTIVNVAIPQMQTAFRASIGDVQWIATVYMLTQAVVIPTVPFLTARFGAKRAYVWSLAAFLAASLLCGLAWDLPSLVFFRLLQGIGGGTLLPLVWTLLYGAFPREERGTAASMLGMPLMLAPAFGPLLGGFLVTNFGWPWAFFVNAPIGVIALIVAQRSLRADRGAAPVRFDRVGFFTIAAGSASLLYAVASVSSVGPAADELLLAGGGIGLLLCFVAIELNKARRDQQPLLDLRHFAERAFATGALSNVFVALARYGALFLLPLYLQDVRGFSAAAAGAILGSQALATLVTLPIGGRVADRLGPRQVVMSGLLLLAAACALLLTLGETSPLWQIIAIMILIGLAGGLLQQQSVVAMSRIEQHDQKAVAHGSTLLTVLNATAAPLGVALLSSIAEFRGQQHALELAGAALSAGEVARQSSLLGMHDSFALAAVLLLLACAVISLAPNYRRGQNTHAPQAAPYNGDPHTEGAPAES